MRSTAHIRIRMLALVVAVALALSIGFASAQPAHAYGRLAAWQVGLSFNCDNPTLCASQGLGGCWGWAEFDSDLTADAQLTGCQHFTGGPAGGAQHTSSDVSAPFIWFVGPNGDFFLTGETDTITGKGVGGPTTVTIAYPAPTYFDTGIPAQAGHYSARTLYGMQAPPGMNFEIQVTQLHK